MSHSRKEAQGERGMVRVEAELRRNKITLIVIIEEHSFYVESQNQSNEGSPTLLKARARQRAVWGS